MNEFESEELEVKEKDISEEEDNKKLAEYYLHQISIAKKQHEKFYDRGEKAIKEYLGNYPHADDELKEERRLNIFNSIINTMLPGYYARTPKAEVNLRKKLGNVLDTIGAEAIENGSQYCLEECQDFDEVATQAVKSFLIVGRATLWERYEVETEMVREQVPVIMSDGYGFLYADGTPLPEDSQTIWDGEQYVVLEEYEKVTSEKAITEFVHYKDFLQSPARLESEIDWKARRVYLSKAEFKERFPDFDINNLSFDTVPEELEELGHEKDKAKNTHGKVALWEVWVKSKNKVLFLCETYEEGAIEVGEPPLELANFFPCGPSLLANVTQDSAVPTCDFHLIHDLLKEVERLTTRIHACAEAIKVNAAYDKSLGNLMDEMFSTDFLMIPIDDFKTFSEKGSLEQRVFYAPVKPYVDAIAALGQARDDALNKIYEVTGSSDVLRGSTSPVETAAAQQLKGNFAQHRFSLRQRQVQAFLGAQHRIKAEIMCAQFSEETLFEICKGEELTQQIPTQQDPQTGQTFPQFGFEAIVEYLRDPYKLYKIDIETDSMIALDEGAERQQRTEYLNSVAQFVSQVLPAMQQYPALAPMFMEMVTFATRSYRAGKELESVIEQQLEQFKAQIEQQAQQAQQQPEDPKMVENQVKLQIAQIEAQSDQQQVQADIAKTQTEAQLKQLEVQAKMEEIQLKREQMSLEAQKTVVDVQHEAEKQNLEYKIMELTNKLEQLRVQYEIMEKIPTAQPQPQASKEPINITLQMPGGQRKVVKYIDGGAVIQPIDEE